MQQVGPSQPPRRDINFELTTPTRKTRRGKRGGRGRSLSPGPGANVGLVPRAAVVASTTAALAAGGWLSKQDVGAGSQQQQQQPQPQPQPQHRHAVSSYLSSQQLEEATGRRQSAAATTAWGHQDLFDDPLSVSWMNTSRSFYQAKQSFGHESALEHHAENVGTGAGRGPAAAAAAGRGGGYGGPRPPGLATGGCCPPPREPLLMQVERIQVHLSDMACLISNYNMREFSLSPTDMAKVEEQLRGASALMRQLQRNLGATKVALGTAQSPSLTAAAGSAAAAAVAARAVASTPPVDKPQDTTSGNGRRATADAHTRNDGPMGLLEADSAWRSVMGGASAATGGVGAAFGGDGEGVGVSGGAIARVGTGPRVQAGQSVLATGCMRPAEALREGVLPGQQGAPPVRAPAPRSCLPVDADISGHLCRQIGEERVLPASEGTSATLCSTSSRDIDGENVYQVTKKKKRRGKRGVRKSKKQMEGFAGFPLPAGLGPEFAGQPRRRLPKAPSLEIMRDEHDLSQYCLQDDDPKCDFPTTPGQGGGLHPESSFGLAGALDRSHRGIASVRRFDDDDDGPPHGDAATATVAATAAASTAASAVAAAVAAAGSAEATGTGVYHLHRNHHHHHRRWRSEGCISGEGLRAGEGGVNEDEDARDDGHRLEQEHRGGKEEQQQPQQKHQQSGAGAGAGGEGGRFFRKEHARSASAGGSLGDSLGRGAPGTADAQDAELREAAKTFQQSLSQQSPQIFMPVGVDVVVGNSASVSDRSGGGGGGGNRSGTGAVVAAMAMAAAGGATCQSSSGQAIPPCSHEMGLSLPEQSWKNFGGSDVVRCPIAILESGGGRHGGGGGGGRRHGGGGGGGGGGSSGGRGGGCRVYCGVGSNERQVSPLGGGGSATETCNRRGGGIDNLGKSSSGDDSEVCTSGVGAPVSEAARAAAAAAAATVAATAQAMGLAEAKADAEARKFRDAASDLMATRGGSMACGGGGGGGGPLGSLGPDDGTPKHSDGFGCLLPWQGDLPGGLSSTARLYSEGNDKSTGVPRAAHLKDRGILGVSISSSTPCAPWENPPTRTLCTSRSPPDSSAPPEAGYLGGGQQHSGSSRPFSPPRYRATVADVQEAFERADTRVAMERERNSNGEGAGVDVGCRGGRGGGGGGGGGVITNSRVRNGLDTDTGCGDQVRVTKEKEDGRALKVGLTSVMLAEGGCVDEGGQLGRTLRPLWIDETDGCVESSVHTPRIYEPALSLIAGKPPHTGLQLLQQEQEQQQPQQQQSEAGNGQQQQHQEQNLKRSMAPSKLEPSPTPAAGKALALGEWKDRGTACAPSAGAKDVKAMLGSSETGKTSILRV